MARATGKAAGSSMFTTQRERILSRHSPPAATTRGLPASGRPLERLAARVMPSSSKDKKRKSSSPTHTTSSPSTAVLSEVISQADKLKKKKVAPTAHAPPASIGDALKDEMRKNQQRKSKDAAAVASSTSWQTDESAPFPRGGGSALTPLEHKAVVTAAREEALFEEPEPAAEGGGKAADAINDHGASSAGAIAAGGGAELVRAHALRRKAMAGGTRSLCAVCEVASDQLMVQLPWRPSWLLWVWTPT